MNYHIIKDGYLIGHGTCMDGHADKVDTYGGTLVEGVAPEWLCFPPLPEKTYAELRRFEYPPIQDLADALYWQAQGDESKMVAYLAAVEAVKAAYPKPEAGASIPPCE